MYLKAFYNFTTYRVHTSFISFCMSSKSKWVYVFSVTPISKCPIIFCNVLGFIPDFATLEQKVCGQTYGIENAVAFLSYPEKAFGNPKALRAFISTNAALSTLEILKSFPAMCADGRSRYFSDNVKTVWHWIHTRSVPQRKYRDTDCWCHWHIIFVSQELANIDLFKMDIIESVVPFIRKSIRIYSYVQKQVMILKHLWN